MRGLRLFGKALLWQANVGLFGTSPTTFGMDQQLPHGMHTLSPGVPTNLILSPPPPEFTFQHQFTPTDQSRFSTISNSPAKQDSPSGNGGFLHSGGVSILGPFGPFLTLFGHLGGEQRLQVGPDPLKLG